MVIPKLMFVLIVYKVKGAILYLIFLYGVICYYGHVLLCQSPGR